MQSEVNARRVRAALPRAHRRAEGPAREIDLYIGIHRHAFHREQQPLQEETTIKIYLAGPLGFSEAGRAFHQQRIIPILEKLGHQLLDPWADPGDVAAVLNLPFGTERRDAWRKINPEIGRKNQRLIDECDVIFAVLDGPDVDSGTAAEIGYGFARRKPILGYRGDLRLSADNEGGIVNLQVEYFIRASGGDIISQISDLPSALAKLPARTQT